MKNYLIFTLEYPPFKGGVANYYENLVKHWPSENIFVLNNNDNKLINKKLPILKWLPALFALKKIIKEKNIDYVIVGNILPLGTVALILSKFIKFKFAVIIHGTDIAYAQKKKRKKKLAQKILAQADKIICNSSYTLEITKKYINFDINNKSVVVNPGINREIKINKDLIQKITKENKLENKFIIFSISRLIKRKGQDKIIQAMPEVLSYIPNAVFCIAGTGEDEEYLKQIRDSFPILKNKVKFLGKINEEEKWAWLKASDLFVLPTRTEAGNMEGFGIVYLEANLAGKAVIAGKSGGVADAVENNVNGVLADPENLTEIADTIIKLARDNELRNKLGEQGRERAIKYFNWEKQIQNLYNFLNF